MFERVVFGLGAITLSLFLASVCVLLVVKTWQEIESPDTAKDVMQSCKDTGMYLTKGYALSCKVLENNP